MSKRFVQILMLLAFTGGGFLGSTPTKALNLKCYFGCGDQQEECVIREYIGHRNPRWKEICKKEFDECLALCPPPSNPEIISKN